MVGAWKEQELHAWTAGKSAWSCPVSAVGTQILPAFDCTTKLLTPPPPPHPWYIHHAVRPDFMALAGRTAPASAHEQALSTCQDTRAKNIHFSVTQTFGRLRHTSHSVLILRIERRQSRPWRAPLPPPWREEGFGAPRRPLTNAFLLSGGVALSVGAAARPTRRQPIAGAPVGTEGGRATTLVGRAGRWPRPPRRPGPCALPWHQCQASAQNTEAALQDLDADCPRENTSSKKLRP